MKFISLYVATGCGEIDPCYENIDQFEANSLAAAVKHVKEQQIKEITKQVEDDGDEISEEHLEFFRLTKKIKDRVNKVDLGSIDSGEEGLKLIIPENSVWYKRFNNLTSDGTLSWKDKVWEEFEDLF